MSFLYPLYRLLPKLKQYFLLIMKKVALITGITGQDGSFLAEFFNRKKGMKFMVSSVVLLHLIQDVSNIFIWMNGYVT